MTTSPPSYRARLEAMFEQLRRHPKIRVKQAFLGPPVPAYELASYRHLAGGALSPGLEALWSEVSFVDLEWSCKHPLDDPDEPELTGSVHILPPARTFSDWEDVLWFDFIEPDHPYRHIRPFDFFVPEAAAVLYPIPGEHEVYYHYCGEELHPTGMSVEQWFERLLRSRGCWYWIEACCVDGQDSAQTRQLFEAMPLLFEDFDPADFSPLTTRGELPT